jgi:hypothetical protein
MLHGSCGLLICQVALVSSNGMAEPGCAADAFQRPLHTRFQARLTPGVRLHQIRGDLSLGVLKPNMAKTTFTSAGS